MSARWVSRFAPTPSGFLHEGNLLNLLLIQKAVTTFNGALRLRVDDLDRERFRMEYLEDIFRNLEWLNIQWTLGPKSTEDHQKNHSQHLRIDQYKKALEKLTKSGHTFNCACTRKELHDINQYPGTCRNLGLDGQEAPVVRLNHEESFVLWTRADLPAYQLACVVDDYEHGTNLIVRGEDLKESSHYQSILRSILYPELSKTLVYHHPLITAGEEKLSKSHLKSTLAPVYRRFASIDHLKDVIEFDRHWINLERFLVENLTL
jgi:glutamyl/glutaminyl-tRNA synthetase